MSTIKPVWTENVNLHTSAALAFGASVTDDIDLDTLGADLVTVTIEIIFGGTPDGDTLIELFRSADSGSNDDTIPATSFRIPFATSATKRKTFTISAAAYAAIKVTNEDSADSVTYEAWYAWRNWNSA